MGLQLWATHLAMMATQLWVRANPSHGQTSAHMPTVQHNRPDPHFLLSFPTPFCIILTKQINKTNAPPLEHFKSKKCLLWNGADVPLGKLQCGNSISYIFRSTDSLFDQWQETNSSRAQFTCPVSMPALG